MVWAYKWDEWFLVDENDILRVHVFRDPDTKKWSWFLFDLDGNVVDYSHGGPTAEDAKSDAEEAVKIN